MYNRLKNFVAAFWLSLDSESSKADGSWYVLRISAALIIFGVFISVISFVTIFIADEVYSFDFCFGNNCFKNFYNYFSTPFIMIQWSLTGAVGVFALGSFGIACKTYSNNKSSNDFGAHIAHLSLFKHYVESEIAKKKRIKQESVDILKWYNLIYPKSERGDLEVSIGYRNHLQDIGLCMESSSINFIGPASNSFDYKVHQQSMINVLSPLGVYLKNLPRMDFWEVEEEVISLIIIVNRSFCKHESGFINLELRKYR
ncbi:retron Ec48 family effector membrane protein [Vreelandella stevensii]|uniref:retron Ec48 family effector membrane protein n=1 Tax=Vreelandella stevensii TaxID=502821 RepID=UPI0037490CF4